MTEAAVDTAQTGGADSTANTQNAQAETASQTQEQTAQTGGGNGSDTGSWRTYLSDEFREHEALKDVTDINALVKEHVDLKELAKRVPNVPEGPDGYVIDIPAGLPKDENFIALMKESALKAGMGQEQFKVMADSYIALQKAALDYIAQEREKGLNALKLEWGNKYDTNTNVAQQTFKKFAPTDDEAKYLKDTGLSSDPVLVRIFHRVGSSISEDFTLAGDGGVQANQQSRADGKPSLKFDKSFPAR